MTVVFQGAKPYTLINAEGMPYKSAKKGALGGYWKGSRKIYGQLNCTSALRWIAKGHYAKHRVFFKNESTAIKAGFRPCGSCMKDRYAQWKADPKAFQATVGSRLNAAV